MSRQNKVNPGAYTQRGRLTPDDAARELQKMRQTGSQHTWQPTKKDALPRRESKDPAAGTETTEDHGGDEDTSREVDSRQRSRATANKSAAKPTPVKAKAKAAKAAPSKRKAARPAPATKSSGKEKAGTAAKRTVSAPKRKAVLARNVGGRGRTPRAATKRRKN